MPRTRSGSGRRGTARLLPELGAVETRERPAARDQLRERALLDDAAVVEDQDDVRPPDRREPVRDDEGRAPGQEPLQPLHDERLRGGVERRGGLVEYEERRIAEDRARDRDAQLLAGGERGARLAHHRLEAFLEPRE